ncbi:MAG: phosphatase PAP2 family protein [Saprospiraceae bacterium]|nr:phosphatase PAP2 family protein [Saprospiraceae bacterium]
MIDLDEFEFFDKEFDFLISVNPNKARSDKLLYVSLVLPGMLLIDHNSRADFFRWGLMYAQTLLLVQGITDVTKYAVKRPRPYTLALGRQNEDYLLSANDRASFFSGHTSASAASSFFFARTFADYYPRSPFKNYVWGAAIAIPAMTGYLRVRAGKHYPSDVLVGYAVGALVGLAIPQLHKKQKISKRMRLRLGGQSVGLLYNL